MFFLIMHPRPLFLHEHPKGGNVSGISFFAKDFMDLGICESFAAQFYDFFLIWCQFPWNAHIVMAVCNRVAGIQVILYCLTGMMHHG